MTECTGNVWANCQGGCPEPHAGIAGLHRSLRVAVKIWAPWSLVKHTHTDPLKDSF